MVSTTGIWLIRHFNKSIAPLAIFFLEMYLSAQSEAGIRMVTRMHYRKIALLSVGMCNQVFERTWFVVAASVGIAIHDVRRRELASIALS